MSWTSSFAANDSQSNGRKGIGTPSISPGKGEEHDRPSVAPSA